MEYQRVRQSREVPGGKSRYGRSYRPQSSRISLKKTKHVKFKLSYALSISLAKKYPVLGYQIQDQNFDGQSFAQFVKKRQRCQLVTHTTYSIGQPFTVPRHRKNASWKTVWLKCTNKLECPQFSTFEDIELEFGHSNQLSQ